MAKLSLIAKLIAQEGKGPDMEAVLKNLMEATDEEPGLEIYAAHKDPNSPETFYFYELYTDDAALGVHGQGERMKAAMAPLGDLLAGAPEITMLTPLVAKGLDV